MKSISEIRRSYEPDEVPAWMESMNAYAQNEAMTLFSERELVSPETFLKAVPATIQNYLTTIDWEADRPKLGWPPGWSSSLTYKLNDPLIQHRSGVSILADFTLKFASKLTLKQAEAILDLMAVVQ